MQRLATILEKRVFNAYWIVQLIFNVQYLFGLLKRTDGRKSFCFEDFWPDDSPKFDSAELFISCVFER